MEQIPETSHFLRRRETTCPNPPLMTTFWSSSCLASRNGGFSISRHFFLLEVYLIWNLIIFHVVLQPSSQTLKTQTRFLASENILEPVFWPALFFSRVLSYNSSSSMKPCPPHVFESPAPSWSSAVCPIPFSSLWLLQTSQTHTSIALFLSLKTYKVNTHLSWTPFSGVNHTWKEKQDQQWSKREVTTPRCDHKAFLQLCSRPAAFLQRQSPLTHLSVLTIWTLWVFFFSQKELNAVWMRS